MKHPREKTSPFRCPRCGTATSGNLQFCPECGLPLNDKCQECGALWRYYYKYFFCPSCGAKLKKRI